MGAEATADPDKPDDTTRMVSGMTDGRGFDAAIDATGIPAVWESCAGLVRKGGTAVLFGGARPGTTVTFDTGKLHYGELTVKGIYHHTPTYIRKALDFIIERGETLDPVITTSMPLEATESALRLMARREALKVEIVADRTQAL
jgi:L-iditol 2-dehydrogenase